METRRNNPFGLISLILISILNVVWTLPLFGSMLAEQIKIGAGTNLDIAAIAVWIIEGICIVPLAICVVFTIVSITKKDKQAKIIINIVQIALYIILHVLANLFMFI